MMRTISNIRRLKVAAGAGLALLAACFYIGSMAGAAAPPPGPQGPMPVEVMTIKESTTQIWSEYSGRLDAVEFVELRPQVSGAVKEIRFRDGQEVKKGDTLYVIDPAPYEAAVAAAQAEHGAAESRSILAQKELARVRDLLKTNAVAGTVVDARESEADVAKSSIDAAAAKLKQARIDLNYAYVKAPIAGRVGRAEIKLGNLVQSGQNAPLLTTIVANDKVYADFDVDEKTYLASARGGADALEESRNVPVKLSVRGDKDVVYDGMIDSFDNRINTATGTIRARALFQNADGALLPGMFVTVKMGSATEDKKILIPERAVGTDQDRKFVYVVDGGNKVTYREIKMGAETDGNRVVLSGLKPGEKVIVEGLMRIRPDMIVAPKEVAPAKVAPEPQELLPPAKEQ
jgi:multidrug efflux system membrane fusion protein